MRSASLRDRTARTSAANRTRGGLARQAVKRTGAAGQLQRARLRDDELAGEGGAHTATSKSQPSDRFWGMKQGATEYVTKPWNAAELLQTMRRHL